MKKIKHFFKKVLPSIFFVGVLIALIGQSTAFADGLTSGADPKDLKSAGMTGVSCASYLDVQWTDSSSPEAAVHEANVSNDTVTLKGKANKAFLWGTKNAEGTVTLTNTYQGYLTINYTAKIENKTNSVRDAYIKHNNSKLISSNDTISGSVTLSNNDSIELYCKTGDTSHTCTVSFKITSIEPQTFHYNVTVLPAADGITKASATASNSNLTEIPSGGTTFSVDSATGLYVDAIASSSSKPFAGWEIVSNGSGTKMLFSTANKDRLYFSDHMTIRPVFSDSAVYRADGNLYLYLDEAKNAAASGSNKTIRVEHSGKAYLFEQSLNGRLSIPSGVTLLIPRYSDDNGSYVYDSSVSTFGTVYASLTIPSNLTLTIEQGGKCVVSALQSHAGTYVNGCIAGDYAKLILDGTLIVNGELHAYGVIERSSSSTTSGNITINASGKLYQFFEVTDYRGGTSTASITGKVDELGWLGNLAGALKDSLKKIPMEQAVFPFSQFYLSNVRVKTTYAAGSALIGKYLIYVETTNDTFVGDAPIIGGGNSTSLFCLSNGSIIMDWMDTSKKSQIQVCGTVSTKSFSVNLKVSVVSVNINSADYVVPFFAGYDIIIKNGGTLTLNNAFKLLPGCSLTVEEGGALNVVGDLYLYDFNDHQKAFYALSKYRVLPRYDQADDRTEGTDAKLVIGGTVTVTGHLYCSAGAGSASSSISAESASAKLDLKSDIVSSKSLYEGKGTASETQAIAFGAPRGILYRLDQNGALVQTYSELPKATYYAARVGNTDTYAWYTSAYTFCYNGKEQTQYYTDGASHTKDQAKSALGITLSDASGSISFKWKEERACNSESRMHGIYLYEINADLTTEYRIHDYIWLNAHFTIDLPEGATLSIDPTMNGDISSRGLGIVHVNGNEYYIVRKVFSDELPNDIVIHLQYTSGSQRVQFATLFSFTDFEVSDENIALKSALDLYGYTAKEHFGKQSAGALTQDQQAALNTAKAEIGASDLAIGKDGIGCDKITNVAANFYFENRIGIMIRFKLADTDLNHYQKIGMLYGDKEVLVLDNGKTIQGSSGNAPTEDGSTSFNTTVFWVDSKGDTYVTVCYDIPSTEYGSTAILQPFVVMKDGTQEGTRYEGIKYTYGLKTYIKRVYKDDDTAWNNFLLSVWNLASVAGGSNG